MRSGGVSLKSIVVTADSACGGYLTNFCTEQGRLHGRLRLESESL